MHTIHLVAGLDPRYGGPSYSIPRLCRALAEIQVRTELLSVATAGNGPDSDDTALYVDHRFPWRFAEIPGLRGLRHSPLLTAALREKARTADVIHNHGLWLTPNVVAGSAAARAATPLVVSPRGMLAPEALKFSTMKKRIFWALFQGRAIRRAACLHATSEREYSEIRAFGLTQPVAIIPNGIDIPSTEPAREEGTSGGRTVLSLGRIHPIKGLDGLLRAWALVEPAYPDWRLRIAGPAEQRHDEELRTLAKNLGLSRVSIEGPLYGEAKGMAYREADLFVLPSHSENFGVTVAEALAYGRPAISTRGTPWARLETEGCGWWVEHGAQPLAAALHRAMAMPRTTLDAMGAKGRAWVEREFSWQRVARDMLDVYRWVHGTGSMPGAVRVD